MGGSLHCSCGVWLVKETPLSAVRLRRGRCWVAASIRRSCGGVCVCTRVPVKGHFLSPKPDRLSGRPLGQAQQQQQQPGLAAESPKEEGHQVLHRSLVWQEGKGPAWTHQQGGVRTRWGFTVQREEGLRVCPFCVSPAVPTRLLSLTLGVLLGGVEEVSVFFRV